MNDDLLTLRTTRATQAYSILAWAVGSIVIGGALWAIFPHGDGGRAFWRAVGVEFVAWGAVDLVFAGLGLRQTLQVKNQPTDGPATEKERADRDQLIASLAFNHYLNVGYLALAAGLLVWAVATKSTSLYGHGTGVLVQGGFLFVFDLVFLRRLRKEKRPQISQMQKNAD